MIEEYCKCQCKCKWECKWGCKWDCKWESKCSISPKIRQMELWINGKRFFKELSN